MAPVAGVAAAGALVLLAEPAGAEASHTVESGDTVSHLASRFGVEAADLVALNALANPDLIRVGQVLRIPTAGPGTAAPAPAPSSAPSPAGPSGGSGPTVDADYVVQMGDTLSAVAHRFGTNVETLIARNGIADPNRIYAGQHLMVSGPPPATAPSAPILAPPAASASVHTVAAGETLGAIAARYGFDVGQLAAHNGLADANTIWAGQEIHLPTSGVPAALFGSRASDPELVEIHHALTYWADAYGLPVDLVEALAYLESGWNNEAVSSVGARGIGQLMPDTVVYVNTVLLGGAQLDPAIPAENIRMSTRYLRALLDQTGDENLMLASYYQGLGAVREIGLYEDTKAYVANVQALRPYFR